MIRIGIDCIKWDLSDIGGVNTYIYGLINAFVKLSKHKFVIFCLP